MSETGKQYTIISENSDKKDFSTLYNHLQDALSKRFDQGTELNDETTTFFNKIKLFHKILLLQKQMPLIRQ